MNKLKTSKMSTKSTLWEKIVYGFGDVGANYCNTFIAMYITIYGLAYGGMLPMMSLEENDRSIIVTLGRFLTTGGVTIMFYITPMLLALGGGERSNGAWHMVANIYSVICTVCVLAVGIFVKEKEFPMDQTIGEGNSVSIKDGEYLKKLKIVLSTKYTWLLVVLFFLFYVFSGLTSARTYFFKDVLGDLGLFGTASMLANIPALFAMPFVPVLFKIFGRKKTIIVSTALFSLSNLIFVFCSGNVTAVYACITAMGIAWVPLTAAIFMYMADLADYIFMKNGIHVEAISFMTSSVGIKIGTGIGSAAVGWGLALSGYNASAGIQSVATQRGIVAMTTIAPMILGILVIVIMLFWNIDKEKQALLKKAE